MIEDAELLHRYAEDRSEEAFAELVRRRVNLVYSVALRQVGGDAHLAEDVTQRVFADLARKAKQLAGHAVLSGWLYRSAQFAASDVVRSERRRRAREQEAQTMNETVANPTDTVDWEKFRPVLDEVMGEMDDEDRDAVALRFFEERSFAEIGVALRLTEDAARKRVARVLDKLHVRLARRGVTSTTAALGIALAGQAAAAAPAGLATSITGAAMAGALAGPGGWLTTFMTMSKLQIGIAGLLAAAGTTGYFLQAETNRDLRREIAALQGQQPDVAALRAENRQLAATAAEVEILRNDDFEFKQLAQRADAAKKAIQEKERVAQARASTVQTAAGITEEQANAEIKRLNEEGNLLVEEYKQLNEKSNDPALGPEAKANARIAATQKVEAIKLKQRAVKAFIEDYRALHPSFVAPRPAVTKETEALRAARTANGSFDFVPASTREPPSR